MSVPGRKRTYWSALAAVRVKRGSTTISLRAVLLGVQHVQHRHRMRLGGVGADEEHRLRVLHVVVRVRHRAVAPGVRHAGDRRGVADARLVVAVVGAPERDELAQQLGLLVVVLGRADEESASGPDSLRISSIFVGDLVERLVPADALLLAVHRASSGTSGGASRRVMPCSRTEAPLAQCAPRLSGESNTGSWRTHTPFCTTASIAQPTEQCVHTVRFTVDLALRRGRLAACASPIIERQLSRERAGAGGDAGALEKRASVDRPTVHSGKAVQGGPGPSRHPRIFAGQSIGRLPSDLGWCGSNCLMCAFA